MEFRFDRHSKKPLYKQIAEYVEQGISSGEFPPEKSLPSERKLAEKLNVNRSTIVAAYDELQSLGIVQRRKGSGTYISTDIWGISSKRIPNWGRYVEDGSFLPNLPLVQKIRTETQDNHLINFASGELAPDLLPDKIIGSIISNKYFSGYLGYDHPLGNKQLRETVINHVKEYKLIQTNPDSILITSGAQQAIHLIIQCLLKPGDAVAIEDPSYAYSLPIFHSAGLRTFHLSVDENGVDPDDIISLYKKHRIRMFFLNPDFQNPTGTKMPLSRRRRILDISAEYGIPIIEDDPYSLTSFNGEVGPNLKSMDENGTVIYISSLSKIVASGLRIGWVIGPQKVIERLADAKQQVDFGHSIFPQWVANEFLDSKHFNQHILILRKELKKRRDLMKDALLYLLGKEVSFHLPEGGIHLWCKLDVPVKVSHLLEHSIQQGVVFVPGNILGTKNGFVRLTFGRCEIQQVEEGIKRFATALRTSYR
ncbi:PLP-dependent aminotransferase family protein [Caldibacillus lycopersici]|uniref:PLP-dependent aminotransferase family protein n=1 Tax=Perspicuibacillus lycopersici TaxID=1325689 RepID=A0AAE3LNR3_9BACI|nr:PLP-dependent aminotransferase family protein [Perspicuibacillus lycopersici]MCU9614995.1 PLP-dependent aminotransferase family protein [Perspicuibacillus lycopersici]